MLSESAVIGVDGGAESDRVGTIYARVRRVWRGGPEFDVRGP